MALTLTMCIVTLIPIGISHAIGSYKIYTNDDVPYGVPYKEWIGKWWAWWFGIPNDLHPTTNNFNSKSCSAMQNGSVWFMPDVIVTGGKLDITCEVPRDTSVLIPITTTITERGLDPVSKCPTLEECTYNIETKPGAMDVKVDGNRVDVSKLNGNTGPINITFPENPVRTFGVVAKCGTPTCTFPGLATGYMLFLHDLSPGTHIVELTVVDKLKGNPQNEPPRAGIYKIVVK